MSTPQSSIPSEVSAMFASMNESFAQAEASTGEGFQGEWPPEGTHDCSVTGLIMKPDQAKFKNAEGTEVKLPCALIQFEYEWAEPETSPTYDPNRPPLAWKGEAFRLVPGYHRNASIPENMKTAFRIAEERFKGHASKILNRQAAECTNVGECVQAMLSKINGDTRVVASVKVVHREGKLRPNAPAGTRPPVYKTEFIQGLI